MDRVSLSPWAGDPRDNKLRLNKIKKNLANRIGLIPARHIAKCVQYRPDHDRRRGSARLHHHQIEGEQARLETHHGVVILPEAIEAYKKAIQLKPTYGEAHANLADVYRLTGKWDEAIASYRLATTFITNDADLYSKYGYVATPQYIDYTNLGWAYYNVAQANLRERNEADYKLNLGKARDAFVRANSLNPVPKVAAAINMNLGMTLTDLGDYPGSIAALKKATDLQRDWIPAINELGIAYRKNGDLENAVKQFKRAIELDDKFAVAYYNLAEAEFRRNNLKEAKKSYEKLKSMNRVDLTRTLEMATNGGILK